MAFWWWLSSVSCKSHFSQTLCNKWRGLITVNRYRMFFSMLPALTSLTLCPHMLPDALCYPRGKRKLHLVQGCLMLLCGCDQEWDSCPAATAAVQEQPERCIALAQQQCLWWSSVFPWGDFLQQLADLGKEKSKVYSSHSGSCFQRHQRCFWTNNSHGAGQARYRLNAHPGWWY